MYSSTLLWNDAAKSNQNYNSRLNGFKKRREVVRWCLHKCVDYLLYRLNLSLSLFIRTLGYQPKLNVDLCQGYTIIKLLSFY